MESCYCCGKLLTSLEEKKRRRMLSNPGLQNSLSTLSLLASEVNRYVDTERLRSGYVCRQYAGLLEKYEQLHKQLISNLSNAMPILPKRPGASPTAPAPSPITPPVGSALVSPRRGVGRI